MERYVWSHMYHNKTRVKLKPPPYNVTVVKGSVHATLSRAFVNFTLNDPKAQSFMSWAKDVVIPDEMVFATLNYNPQVFKAPGSFTGRQQRIIYWWWHIYNCQNIRWYLISSI